MWCRSGHTTGNDPVSHWAGKANASRSLVFNILTFAYPSYFSSLHGAQQGKSLNRLFVRFDVEEYGIEYRYHNKCQYRCKAQAKHDNDSHVEEEHVSQ